MNHVSVSPTDGNGPTQGQRKTAFALVRREQAVGSEDVKVTAMNMYKYNGPNNRAYIRGPSELYKSVRELLISSIFVI